MRPFFPLLLLCSLILSVSLQAQNYSLRLHPVSGDSSTLIIQAAPPSGFSDGAAILRYLHQLIPSLQEKGFLAASLDSFSAKGQQYDAWVYLGASYHWAELDLQKMPPALLTNVAINSHDIMGKALKPRQLSRITEQILDYYENNGHPFARVWLDSIILLPDNGIVARLQAQPGALRKIDSVDLQGDIRISAEFLERYLDLFIGDLYSEKKLRTISPRLRELSYLQEAEPWKITFKSSETRLTLHLKTKKANTLNALIGLLPNSQASGKFLLTVDAQVALQNALGHGESIGVVYQNLQYKSPSLKADFIYPYLFGTLFGAEGHFDYYRKDTSFRRTSLEIGTRYQISALDYLRVYFSDQSNRLITVDTSTVRINRRLPDNIDVTAYGGGMELSLNRTDYRLNPHKGFAVRLSATALLRNIIRSDAVTGISDGTGFNYGSLYDTLEKRRYQLRLNADAAYYVPVGKRLVLRLGYAGGYISGDYLFQNELYQVGGFRVLRGFDELSIYTDHYHMLNAELRLPLSLNSYIYLFSDNAWVQSHYGSVQRDGIYNGFGVGTTLETKNGLFTLSLGLGRSDLNPAQFRQAKIHFGYVAFF